MRDVGMVDRVLRRALPALCVTACAVVGAAAASASAHSPPTGSGISVVLLQHAPRSGAFTSNTIFALDERRIEYAIRVTNTGSTALALTLHDALCDKGTVSGPRQIAPTLHGDVLEPGGEAQYKCSHLLKSFDASPFVDTATVTGTPSTGASVSLTVEVTAYKQAIGTALHVSRHRRGDVKAARRVRRRHRAGRRFHRHRAGRRFHRHRRGHRPPVLVVSFTG